MTTLKKILQVLFWFFAAYWAVFIAYTVKNLVAGGPGEVIAWYQHISHTSGLSLHWDWRLFLAQQIVVLATTVILWFLGRLVSRAGGHSPAPPMKSE